VNNSRNYYSYIFVIKIYINTKYRIIAITACRRFCHPFHSKIQDSSSKFKSRVSSQSNPWTVTGNDGWNCA